MSVRVERDADVERLARSLSEHEVRDFDLVIVLGSGLGSFAERLTAARRIPYAELDGMPASRVVGHAGELVIGELGRRRVLVQRGRVHLYEGWSAREVTRAVRAFCRAGAKAVVLTNAAGGLRREWPAGTLMRIRDHLALQGRAAVGAHERGATRVWDEELGRALELGARDAGVALESGVYAALPGPSYETPAEIRWLTDCGADAVGMSTALEAVAARAAGARVCGISLVTNQAAGIAPHALSHDEVVAAGAAASERFGAVLERAVPRLREVLAARA
ncbi:MAG: purine-nucleoside phosphorylase [Planctomycetes bacterium]|nr:purine-nucleoside phosphorylase [Planctomycetota bacterium]